MSIINILLSIAVLAVIVICASYALPASKTVSRRAVIKANAADIYQLVASTEGFQRFNPYCDTDPSLKISAFGPDTGVGAGFSFEGKEGKGTQTVIAVKPNRQVQMEIDLGPMGKPVQTFSLKEQPDSTEVIWSTRSDFGMNPIGRVFGLFLDKMLGKTYERGLNNLAQAVATA